MSTITRKQLILLVILTLVWGINWPILKIGVTNFPPIFFRSICMWIGLPFLGLVLWKLKISFVVPRAQWRELSMLSFFNMFVWHVMVIVALPYMTSGRVAILGYTMPIFSAIFSVWFFKTPLQSRAWLGVAAATLAVVFLLWHEFTQLAGKPIGVFMVLSAAGAWAYGIQRLRRTEMTVSTLTISFWMTAMTAVVMAVLTTLVETERWAMPRTETWGAIIFNAFGVFVFAQTAWLILARGLPPVASTLSVMFIPVLGVFSGAIWLNEILHWQDWAAVFLIVISIACVLWPTRNTKSQA